MLDFELSVVAHGWVTWSELAELVVAPPAGFPLPLPRGTTDVDLMLDVRPAGLVAADYGLDDDLGGMTVMLRFVAEHHEPAPVTRWGLTIDRTFRFEFLAWFATAEGAQQALDDAQRAGPARVQLGGMVRVATRFRLPALPDLPFLTVETGDPDGWIALAVGARLDAQVDASGAGAELALVARIADLAS
ncbi:MAG TPA: hypothetical protein VGD80_43920, partial [Kofleriaceae bacterium]